MPRARASRFGAPLVLLAQLAACGGGGDGVTAPPPPPPPPGPATVASVSIAPGGGTVAFRGTLTLAATARDAAGAPLPGRPVTWQSSNTAVATVAADGVVTGVLPGAVTITATVDGVAGTTALQVVPADLGRIVDSVRAAFNLPAMGAAIVTRTGGLVAQGVHGVRRWGSTHQVTLNDRWHLGSNAKAMTAFLAAMAVREGRLAWNDPFLSRYPELAPLARPDFAPVTLRDLGSMQAGIIGNPAFTPVGSLAQQRTQVDQWAVQQPPAAARGTYYYSNIAYQLLGEIAGRAWGGGFEQALRDRLWSPLGITTAGLGPTTTAGATDQPSGHTPSGGGWTICEACDNSWANGSGKVHMSLPDWARFVHEVLRADAGQSALLPQADARVLTGSGVPMPGGTTYGFGWLVFNQASRPVQHDGSNLRNLSRALLFLEAGVAYLLTTNAADPAPSGGVPLAAVNALQARLQAYWQTGR